MKYIESYWVEKLPNGVIHLLINTTQREIYFHSFSDEQFLIAGTKEECDNWDESVLLNTEKFLPNTPDTTYVLSQMKEKDQVSFYWIPYNKETRKESIELLNVKIK